MSYLFVNPSYGADGVYCGVEKEEENAKEDDNRMGVYGVKELDRIQGRLRDWTRFSAIATWSDSCTNPIGFAECAAAAYDAAQ